MARLPDLEILLATNICLMTECPSDFSVAPLTTL